jgi:hypothetical protein
MDVTEERPQDDEVLPEDLPPRAPSPIPPMPKIPPRPLDWPPGEGVDVPKKETRQ